MRARILASAGIFFACTIFFLGLHAQEYGRSFEISTVTKVSGKILSIEKIENKGETSGGVHLRLEAGKEDFAVHVGPSWYIDQQNLNLKVGDMIEVKGSRVMIENKPTIIASEIHKEEKVVVLRDETGFPVWSEWRKRLPASN